MSPILTLTRVHLGDLTGHDLKTADASELKVIQLIYLRLIRTHLSPPPAAQRTAKGGYA